MTKKLAKEFPKYKKYFWNENFIGDKVCVCWIYATSTPDRQTHYVTTLDPIAKTLFHHSRHIIQNEKQVKPAILTSMGPCMMSNFEIFIYNFLTIYITMCFQGRDMQRQRCVCVCVWGGGGLFCPFSILWMKIWNGKSLTHSTDSPNIQFILCYLKSVKVFLDRS